MGNKKKISLPVKAGVSLEQIQQLLATKQDLLTAGDNITIELVDGELVISASGGGETPHLYRHVLFVNRGDYHLSVTIYSEISLAFTRETFSKWLYDNGYNTRGGITASYIGKSSSGAISNMSNSITICAPNANDLSIYKTTITASLDNSNNIVFNYTVTDVTIYVPSVSDTVTQIF